MHDGLDERRRRLLFRAWHRGMREVDLITGPFADAHLGTLTESEIDDLERLMDVPEPELLAWVMGQEPTPQAFDQPVFRRMHRSPTCQAISICSSHLYPARSFCLSSRHARQTK